jgi:Fungal Zn(2)-Cys(6) binuclear cluster domain
MAPFQTPPLRVSRTVSACARCRSAKTKCDGKLPACTHCERAGKAAECISSNDEFARGRERSYVASLESRIERLEAERNRLDARNQHYQPVPGPQTANDTQIHHLQRQETSDVAELVSDFGYL